MVLKVLWHGNAESIVIEYVLSLGLTSLKGPLGLLVYPEAGIHTSTVYETLRFVGVRKKKEVRGANKPLTS